MSKVIVTSDDNGNVIAVSKNSPEYGYVRVEQVATQINDQGWLKNVRRSALIKGKVTDLAEAKFTANQELDGKIVVVESFQPFNTENPDRDLKVAGETGIICTVDDQPIYRQTFYTTNDNAVDEMITHDRACQEQIRGVLQAQKAISSLSGLKGFAKKAEQEITETTL